MTDIKISPDLKKKIDKFYEGDKHGFSDFLKATNLNPVKDFRLIEQILHEGDGVNFNDIHRFEGANKCYKYNIGSGDGSFISSGTYYYNSDGKAIPKNEYKPLREISQTIEAVSPILLATNIAAKNQLSFITLT